MDDAGSDPRTDGGLGCDEPGSSRARFRVRRFDDLLRVYASRRNGQRSRDPMLPPQGGREKFPSARNRQGEAVSVPKRSDTALDWLLEENQPSIRYLALTQLLDRPENDGEVQIAKEMIGKTGWAADILAAQKPGGWWVSDERLYQPKYTSTNWMLLILSDLGLTKGDSRIANACELWIERFATPDGGFSMEGMKTGHLCVVGNTARALVRFGYGDHPKVRSAFEWLVEHRDKNGGWGVLGGGGGQPNRGGGGGVLGDSPPNESAGGEE